MDTKTLGNISINTLLNFPIKNFNDLTIILYMLNQIVEAQVSGIFIEHTNKLIYVCAYGKNDYKLINQSLEKIESVEGYIFSNNESVLIEKSIEMDYFKPNSVSSNIVLPITITGTPIIDDNKTIGGLIAFNRERNTLFTEKDLNVLKKVSMYISEFINNYEIQPIDKHTAVINNYFIRNLPFPAFILNAKGKIDNYSDKVLEHINEENIINKSVSDLLKLTDNKTGESINLAQHIMNSLHSNTPITISNVKIEKDYDNLYDMTIMHISPERMVHKIFIYLINTKDINEAKQQLITSIAHELRTPMTAIMGSVQILLSDFSSGELSPTQKEFLNILKNQAQRFSTVLSTILDYKESTDLLGLREEKSDLTKIINEIENVFRKKASEKSIKIEKENIEQEMIVKGEENAIKHIFSQIIDNAIKFSTTNSTIIIKNEGTKLSENKWYKTITIRDFGEGISEDILPHIFESFKRNDEAVHTEIGTGLGLSLVKQIIDTMGGEIEIENHPEGGVIVSLSFLT